MNTNCKDKPDVVFVIPDSSHYKIAFYELGENERVFPYPARANKISKLFSKSRLLVIKRMLFRLYFWLLFYGTHLNRRKNTIICFTDLVYRRIPFEALSWLKTKRAGWKFVVLSYNKIGFLYGIPGNENPESLPDNKKMQLCDKVYLFNQQEANRFGLKYREVYSIFPIKHAQNVLNDVFYCGAVKKEWKAGRLNTVDSIFNYLMANGVAVDFNLFVDKNVVSDFKRTYRINDEIPYDEVLNRVQESNVILEVVEDENFGATFRYYEAIVYNKKLLTNNPAAKTLPYYDPRFIRVFKDVSDIDIDWCKRREDVDYGYKGDFSPKSFYHELLQDFGFNT